MHYDNCAFSNNSAACDVNDPSEANQTLVGRFCGIGAVGGSTISALDIEGLNHAYAGSVSEYHGIENGSKKL